MQLQGYPMEHRGFISRLAWQELSDTGEEGKGRIYGCLACTWTSYKVALWHSVRFGSWRSCLEICKPLSFLLPADFFVDITVLSKVKASKAGLRQLAVGEHEDRLSCKRLLVYQRPTDEAMPSMPAH